MATILPTIEARGESCGHGGRLISATTVVNRLHNGEPKGFSSTIQLIDKLCFMPPVFSLGSGLLQFLRLFFLIAFCFNRPLSPRNNADDSDQKSQQPKANSQEPKAKSQEPLQIRKSKVSFFSFSLTPLLEFRYLSALLGRSIFKDRRASHLKYLFLIPVTYWQTISNRLQSRQRVLKTVQLLAR